MIVHVHVHVHGACASLRAQARARLWTDGRSLTVTAQAARPTWPTEWPTRAGVPRRAAVPQPHSPPGPARGLHRAPGPAVFAQPVVHPAAARAARGHQFGERHAVRPGAQERGPQRGFWPVLVISMSRAVSTAGPRPIGATHVSLARLHGLTHPVHPGARHPVHSLIDQSLHSRLGAETTDGGGFGVGWYDAAPVRGGLPQYRADLE